MVKTRGFPETSPSLLATLNGDAPGHVAWREFFERYAPAVFRVARLRSLDPADADDIVQDVMLAVTAHIGDFRYDRDRGKFRQWVRRIAESKIIDHYRRKSARQDAELEDVHTDDRPSFEALWEEQWRLQDLHWCLDQIAVDIAPRRMEAFRAYVLEGEPAREVAARLGMTEGYVYVTRYHVLQLIRRKMEQLGDE